MQTSKWLTKSQMTFKFFSVYWIWVVWLNWLARTEAYHFSKKVCNGWARGSPSRGWHWRSRSCVSKPVHFSHGSCLDVHLGSVMRKCWVCWQIHVWRFFQIERQSIRWGTLTLDQMVWVIVLLTINLIVTLF